MTNDHADSFNLREKLVLQCLGVGPAGFVEILTFVRDRMEYTKTSALYRTLGRLITDGKIEHRHGSPYRLSTPGPSHLDELARAAKTRGVSVWHCEGAWRLPLPEGVVSGPTPADVLMQLEDESERLAHAKEAV